ncbi:MAG: DsrE/DsrF/DrsH-like family protein [Candidatus Thiodiazotropha sp. (ex Dulcina madagascariensis)]|nr:DsrE/DsrF/DrsH-like family protein [Candidatus Thiodiazotropha sp. (ex Dulcina madagascariensis)]
MTETLPIVEIPNEDLNSWFDQRFSEKMAEREAAHVPSMTIIATKGTLDMAYPPFILSSTAAALGWDVAVFFTFYGLNLLKQDLELKVSPLGNPAMPIKLPEGPGWIKGKEIPLPTSVMTLMPGFESMATHFKLPSLSQRRKDRQGKIWFFTTSSGWEKLNTAIPVIGRKVHLRPIHVLSVTHSIRGRAKDIINPAHDG